MGMFALCCSVWRVSVTTAHLLGFACCAVRIPSLCIAIHNGSCQIQLLGMAGALQDWPAAACWYVHLPRPFMSCGWRRWCACLGPLLTPLPHAPTCVYRVHCVVVPHPAMLLARQQAHAWRRADEGHGRGWAQCPQGLSHRGGRRVLLHAQGWHVREGPGARSPPRHPDSGGWNVHAPCARPPLAPTTSQHDRPGAGERTPHWRTRWTPVVSWAESPWWVVTSAC